MASQSSTRNIVPRVSPKIVVGGNSGPPSVARWAFYLLGCDFGLLCVSSQAVIGLTDARLIPFSGPNVVNKGFSANLSLGGFLK
ncbi:hypothetical protein ACLOJK_011079 [Asimina triloba]